VPAPALRRPADPPRSSTSSAPALRIVLARPPVTRPAIDPQAVSVARVVRHGPPDAIRPAPPVRHPQVELVFARARALWPGLDAKALARTGGDLRRVARLVGRRTALPEDTIVAMLLASR
jgi:hypothetical protein